MQLKNPAQAHMPLPKVPWVIRFPTAAWVTLVLVSVLGGLLAGATDASVRASQRAALLERDAERTAAAVVADTINSKLMGLSSLMGLSNEEIKQDVQAGASPNTPKIAALFEGIVMAYDAEAMFVVPPDGRIRSAWDSKGKSPTGVEVGFRPYFQMGMQGNDNVYAGVSVTRGERSLYFASPIYKGSTQDTAVTGVVVTRDSLTKIDGLLRAQSGITLLVSPQGVVFGSSRPEWIGHLTERPSSEQLKAMRDLKAFGSFVEGREPALLPIKIAKGIQQLEGSRVLVEEASVNWNDPFGNWRIVRIEDLVHTLPRAEIALVSLGSLLLLFVLGYMALNLVRGRYQQRQATDKLRAFAMEQSESNEHKSRIAAAAVRLQQASDMPSLAQAFLAESRQLVGAMQGVVYVCDPQSETRLQLAASAACANPMPAAVAFGEGLLGQCAVNRLTQVLDTAGAAHWTLVSGLGQTPAAALMVAPVLLQQNLVGVVELALSAYPNDAARLRCEEWVGLLAINIEIQRHKLGTEALLAEQLSKESVTADQMGFQQALIDAIPFPMFYKGADTRFQGFNRAYERTFAVQREKLIGKRVLDLDYLPETDRLAYQAEDENAVATAGSVRRLAQIPYADGVVRKTLYSVSGFRRADGSPGGLVGTFVDLSEAGQNFDVHGMTDEAKP